MADFEELRAAMGTPAPRKWPAYANEVHNARSPRDCKHTIKPNITIEIIDDPQADSSCSENNNRCFLHEDIARSRSMTSLPHEGSRRELSPNRLHVDFGLNSTSKSEASIYDLCKMIKSPPQHRRLLAEYAAEKTNTDSHYPNKHESVAHTGSLPPIRPSSPGLRKRTSPLGSPSSPVSLSPPCTSPSLVIKDRFPTSLHPLPDVGRTNESMNQPDEDVSSTNPISSSANGRNSRLSQTNRQDTYTLSGN